jgi:L-alanine-DL-glutamate epimerase-like enolase superfamily enzyme
MEAAFWDLAAQAKGIPVWALMLERILGADAQAAISNTEGELRAYASFAEHRTPLVRAESLDRAHRAGFKGAKIVLRGQSEAEDIAQLRSARANMGDRFSLMVHAHQAWSVSLVEDVVRWDTARALRVIDVARSCGYEWFQEPLHVDEIESQEAMREQADMPIAGGDIANGHGVLRYLARNGAVSVLTPDVSFSGIDACARVLMTCKNRGLDVSPSCYGDGLSLAANLHLAAAWQALSEGRRDVWVEYPWEPPAMVPQYRDALLRQPMEIDIDGLLARPSQPGFGIEIDEKAMKRYAEKFYTLTPVRFAVSTARRAGIRQTAAFARNDRRGN